MATSFKNPRNKTNIFASKKLAINDCLLQFNDLSNAIIEVCNVATHFGRSLQSLEELAMPEIIGSEQVKQAQSKKFNRSAHLMDSLDTFNK
jgi:hypothetical protein